jgi:hypothetical protein
MIKLSKIFILLRVAFVLPVVVSMATAAFSFGIPQLAVNAGFGLGVGPTVFNTYSHDFTTLGTGTSADAAANTFAAPSWGSSWGGVPFFCSPFFGPSAFSASPFSADTAANQWFGTQALEDNTFATSFATGC